MPPHIPQVSFTFVLQTPLSQPIGGTILMVAGIIGELLDRIEYAPVEGTGESK